MCRYICSILTNKSLDDQIENKNFLLELLSFGIMKIVAKVVFVKNYSKLKAKKISFPQISHNLLWFYGNLIKNIIIIFNFAKSIPINCLHLVNCIENGVNCSKAFKILRKAFVDNTMSLRVVPTVLEKN